MSRGISPVQRTLRALRNEGSICEIVERFNPYAGPHGKRVDFLGFGDIIALKPDGIAVIQACGSDFAAHVQKMNDNEYVPEWLKSGKCQSCGSQMASIELWGWRKIKKHRGGKQMIWSPRVKKITMEDL